MFVTEFVIDAEEEKHIAAVQKAMEERGMLDHTIVHGVFVGPARSGKNSLMERLLGRMPSSVSPSTGVAESVVQVKVMQKSATTAANVEESIWSIMDYDDEAIKLMLVSSNSRIEEDDPQLEALNYVESQDVPLEVQLTDSEVVSDIPEPEFDQHVTQLHVPSLLTSIQTPPQLPNSLDSPMNIFKLALKKKKKGLEALQQHFDKTWSLYLTNTGGQMEFQEVLPLLVSGPSMFFFTFRLDRDLNKLYTIKFDLFDGTTADPYMSTLTTMDGILQTLATISAMGTFVYRGLQKREAPLKPKVFFVGTHKDQLDSETANDQIVSIDQQLQRIIRSTSHCKDLVEFASPSQLMFTVNNFSKDDSDFKHIRSAVRRVVIRDAFQMTSPIHWLIYSLAIRKLKSPVITYNRCLEVAKQCGITDQEELNEALYFIHSNMGLIRYFPYEDVKDLVFIDPQFLFDKVTELIVDTFTFEKVGQLPMEEFKRKGIFSVAEFERISMRNQSCITPFQFGKLLEHLRIAARFEIDNEEKYFFPCALAHANESDDDQIASTLVPPLMVSFKCGYCPKGVAGALIKYLMANEMESCYAWEVYPDKIYRNQVSFLVGPLDTIVIKITPTYLEIVCIPNMKVRNREQDCPLGKVCSEVREAVEAGIRQVTSDINYVNAQHSLTFRCECKGDHPGVLRYLGTRPYVLSCSKTNERYPLSPEHELWQVKKSQHHHEPMPPPLATKPSEKSEAHGTCLNEADHHRVLFKQLAKHSAEWRNIGRGLGFIPSDLDVIQAKPVLLDSAPSSWLEAMLAQWLCSGGRLETLKCALWDAGLGQTASELRITTHEPQQITKQGNESSPPMECESKWPQPNSEAGNGGNGKCTLSPPIL